MAKKAEPTVDPTACRECGHRSVKHVEGSEPCNLPRCPCTIGRSD